MKRVYDGSGNDKRDGESSQKTNEGGIK